MNFNSLLNQTAVYWGGSVNDGYGGKTYNDPVEVDVRWSVRQERFTDMKTGVDEVISKAIVFSETDLEIDGKIELTILDDLDSDQLPSSDSMTIKGIDKISSLRSNKYLRKAYLV